MLRGELPEQTDPDLVQELIIGPMLHRSFFYPDQLKPRERCASTSNRNFEGRQGRLGRTPLVSPAMAAAAAIAGRFVDIREWK